MVPVGVALVISVTFDHLSRTSSGVKESVILCLSRVPLPRKTWTAITEWRLQTIFSKNSLFQCSLPLAAYPAVESIIEPVSSHDSWHSHTITGATNSGFNSLNKSASECEIIRYSHQNENN